MAVTLVVLLALVACGGDSSSDVAASAPANGVDTGADALADAPGAGGPAQTDPTPTGEPLAALVNGEPITLDEFQRERDRRALGMTIEPATAAAFDADVLQSLIDQKLIAQAAEREGIVVTEAEIDNEFNVQAEIVRANGQNLEDVLAAQLYTVPEYREVLRHLLLALKVSQVVIDVSPTAPQVHSRHILVADEATARAIIDQLNAGADFAELAAQYSLDGSTKFAGGDLDWVSEGQLLQPEVEAVIFSLSPGSRTAEPVRSSLGYHVIEVLERVEDRPLDAEALAQKKSRLFMEWLQAQRDAATIEVYLAVEPQ